jgi:hypothetical protein
MARRSERAQEVTFVLGGEERRVDLRAPRPVRLDGRSMVPLIDLWVASLLPGDLLELVFEIVTSGPGGAVRCSPPIDPLRFARGFIEIETRELWWDDPDDGNLHGLRARTIVVAAKVQRPPPPPPAKPAEHRTISFAELRRLLPHAVDAYPPVLLRSAPAPTLPLRPTLTEQPRQRV